MIDNGQDGGSERGASDADNGLDYYKLKVKDLEGELQTALQIQAYFVTLSCGTAHLNAEQCDCDERIREINKRLRSLGAFDRPRDDDDVESPESA